MVILKLNTEEAAQAIAYTLRGRKFGKHVVLLKHDQPAIDLAIALSPGKLISQSCPGMVALVVLSLVACHGVLGMWLWVNPPGKDAPSQWTPSSESTR